MAGTRAAARGSITAVTPAQRRTALLAWITVALLGAALTWLGLVSFGLLLTRGGLATRLDWIICGSVLGTGGLLLGGAIWMTNRIRRRR